MQSCNLIPEVRGDGSVVDGSTIRHEVEAICSSEHFISSRRMVRFLRFAVDQTLNGQGSQINEYLVGVEVYERPESFDPRSDNIVRVEARRLRSKLEAYYAAKDRQHLCIIEFPKGSYQPVFRMGTANGQTQPSERDDNFRWLWFSAISAALAVGVVVGWFAHSLL